MQHMCHKTWFQLSEFRNKGKHRMKIAIQTSRKNSGLAKQSSDGRLGERYACSSIHRAQIGRDFLTSGANGFGVNCRLHFNLMVQKNTDGTAKSISY